MKTIPIILLSILTYSASYSQEGKPSAEKRDEAAAEPSYGFEDEGRITKGYEFKFISAKLDKKYQGWGTFSFRWNGKSPVKLHGFEFEKNSDFQVRFEQVSRFRDGKWLKLPILSCGTGADLYTLQPGKEYKILLSMWRFGTDLNYKTDLPRKGDKGVVKIVGENFYLLSEPFALPVITTKE
jgi:hypothetical protein